MRNPYIILDVETGIEDNNISGPGGDANPYGGVPLVAVGHKVSGTLAPTHLEYWDGPGTRPDVVPFIDTLLSSSNMGLGPVIVVGHNVNFDLHHVFREWDTEQVMALTADWTIWDTQTVEFLLSGQYHKNAKLVQLESKYLGGQGRDIGKDEMHALFEAGIGSDKIEKDKLLEYLWDDLDQTERVFMRQVRSVVQAGMVGFVREMMDAQLLAFLMEKEGMPINTDVIPEIVSTAKVEHAGAVENLKQLLPLLLDGDTSNMDALSNHQLSKLLVNQPIEIKWREENGVFKSGKRIGQTKYSWRSAELRGLRAPIDVRKLQGIDEPQLPSTAEKSLAQIGANLPDGTWKEVFEAVLAVRYAEKKHKTYAVGYLGKVCADNKLRTSINNSTAATNRVSSSNPNLQNLPGDM